MEHGRMNITEHETGTMRMFAARTGAKDMVTIEGSVLGGHFMLARELKMVPRLATALFDAGTKKRSKDDIRTALSSRGASIHFSSGGDRTSFQATCLPEDTEFVLTLIAECLHEATFPAAELALQKKRTLAEFEELKTNTQTLASIEHSRLIYDASHVNYADTLAESTKKVSATTRANLLSYQKLLGKGGLVLAITGDITPDEVLKKAERAFSVLPKGTPELTLKKANATAPKARESKIFVADKANVDVFLGAAVPLTYEDPAFIPFTVVSDMLSGRGLSGGHLMRTIRERDGFTYGIYGYLNGFNGRANGALQIWATFSPSSYEKAIAATKKEIRVFLDTGITETALMAKKGQMVGKYAVGLGTSQGLASMLHKIGVEGKQLSYIEEYPSLIHAVTVADLKNAAALVPWNELSVSIAGTIDKKK